MPLIDEPQAPWPYIWPDDTTPSGPLFDSAVMAASALLWAASGRRFGTNAVTGLRPCREPLDAGLGSWPGASPQWSSMWPLIREQPGIVACGWHNQGGDCSCSLISQAVFSFQIASIDQVKIDGAVLDPTAYRIDDWRKLVRVDGGSWPWCQNMNLPDTDVGTWSVDLTAGMPVPTLGQLAVGELGKEFYLSLTGSDLCRLPTRTTQITRQNVTLQMIDANTYLNNNRVGLEISDLFLWTYNRHGLAAPPKVYSRDVPRPRHAGT